MKPPCGTCTPRCPMTEFLSVEHARSGCPRIDGCVWKFDPCSYSHSLGGREEAGRVEFPLAMTVLPPAACPACCAYACCHVEEGQGTSL